MHRNVKENATLEMTENISTQNSATNVRLDHLRKGVSGKTRNMLAPSLEMWEGKLGKVEGTE